MSFLPPRHRGQDSPATAAESGGVDDDDADDADDDNGCPPSPNRNFGGAQGRGDTKRALTKPSPKKPECDVMGGEGRDTALIGLSLCLVWLGERERERERRVSTCVVVSRVGVVITEADGCESESRPRRALTDICIPTDFTGMCNRIRAVYFVCTVSLASDVRCTWFLLFFLPRTFSPPSISEANGWTGITQTAAKRKKKKKGTNKN